MAILGTGRHRLAGDRDQLVVTLDFDDLVSSGGAEARAGTLGGVRCLAGRQAEELCSQQINIAGRCDLAVLSGHLRSHAGRRSARAEA